MATESVRAVAREWTPTPEEKRMANHLDVVPLSVEQHDAAATILARSFQEDPLFVAIWPEPEERARSLLVLTQWNLGEGRNAGIALVTSGVLGVALAFRSADFMPGDDTSGVLETQLGPHAWQRFHAVQAFTYADAELLRLVPDPHWYLHMLGVDPDHQGQGIGSALLNAVHALADADRLPTLLVTFQPRNVPLYRRHGYEIVATGTEPSAGLTYWSMQRLAP
jgi:ribosomal protein S18 acetylase RimI-like enzyme